MKKNFKLKFVFFIKSGTLVKFDKAMPENFSRYILYLNIHDGEEIMKYGNSKRGLIVPYWLNPDYDSACVKK